MNNRFIDFFKNFTKSPIKICGFLVVILSFALLYSCQFHIPDYYTSKTVADQIAQTVAPADVEKAVEHLINKKYLIFNTIFQLWGLSLAVFLFTVIFKIKDFKHITNINVLNNKLFVYLWINLIYPVWGICYTFVYMQDITKYVYNGAADSLGIPFFTTIGMIISFGIIYYPSVNLLAFLTYNTKINRWIYNLFWGAFFALWLMFTLECAGYIFTYATPLLFLIYLIWFMLIIYAIGYKKKCKNLKTNQPESNP